MVVDSPHILDAAHLGLQHTSGVLTVTGPPERGYDRGCVHRFTGGKSGVGFQFKRIDTPLRVSAPGAGQQRLDLTLFVDTHQSLINVVEKHERRPRPRGGSRIQPGRLSRRPDIQDHRICGSSPTLWGTGNQCEAEPQQHGDHDRQATERSVGSHVYVSPVWTPCSLKLTTRFGISCPSM